MRLAHTRLAPSEYLDILKRGQMITHPPLQIKVLLNPSSQLQYAIRIPKKIVPLATKRNRLKRLIRAPLHAAAKEKPFRYKCIITLIRSKEGISEPALIYSLQTILARLSKPL